MVFREIGAFAGGRDEKEDKTPEPAFQPNYYGFIPFFSCSLGANGIVVASWKYPRYFSLIPGFGSS